MSDTRTTQRRMCGLVLVIAFLLSYEPQSEALLQRLVLPAIGALGAYLIVANALAVALAVALLAGIHSAPGADDVLRGWVYPGLAVVSGAIVVTILSRRFAAYAKATRELRVDARQQRDSANVD